MLLLSTFKKKNKKELKQKAATKTRRIGIFCQCQSKGLHSSLDGKINLKTQENVKTEGISLIVWETDGGEEKSQRIINKN